MNIIFIILLSIVLLIFVIVVIKLNIEVTINPLKLSIKLFGFTIYKKEEQTLYNLMVKDIESMGNSKADPKLIKELLKAIKIRVVEFSNNVDKSSPINALTIGFLNVIMPFLRNMSFKNALLVRYSKGEILELKVGLQIRIIEVGYRFIKYKVGKLHAKKA